MLIRCPSDLPYSDVTPKHVYLNRRRFLSRSAAAVGAAAAPFAAFAAAKLNATKTPYSVGGEKITSKDVVTGYNNYYEFGTGKEDPAQNAPNSSAAFAAFSSSAVSAASKALKIASSSASIQPAAAFT